MLRLLLSRVGIVQESFLGALDLHTTVVKVRLVKMLKVLH